MGDYQCGYCGWRFGNIPSWKQHEYECAMTDSARAKYGPNDPLVKDQLRTMPRQNGKNHQFLGVEMFKQESDHFMFQDEAYRYDPRTETYVNDRGGYFTKEQAYRLAKGYEYLDPTYPREPNDAGVIARLAEMARSAV